MKRLVSSSRLAAFALVVVLLIALCAGTLYKLQIIEGAAYYEESQNSLTSRYRREGQHTRPLRPCPRL